MRPIAFKAGNGVTCSALYTHYSRDGEMTSTDIAKTSREMNNTETMEGGYVEQFMQFAGSKRLTSWPQLVPETSQIHSVFVYSAGSSLILAFIYRFWSWGQPECVEASVEYSNI
jgi:hypothetical protein